MFMPFVIIRNTVITYGTFIWHTNGIVQLVCGGTHDTIYRRWLIVGEPRMSCLSDLIPFDIKFS